MGEPEPRQRRLGSIFSLPFKSKNPGSRANSIDSGTKKKGMLLKKEPDGEHRRSFDYKTNVRVVESIDPALVLSDPSSKTTINSSFPASTRKSSLPSTRNNDGFERNKQTGEIIDHTNMLHSLGLTASQDDFTHTLPWLRNKGPPVPGKQILSELKPDLWLKVFKYFTLADKASLAFSCKAFQNFLGLAAWTALAEPENRVDKVNFLVRLDKYLPMHLLCFDCAIYHLRTQVGEETLKPINTLNAVYECPNLSNPNKMYPRFRITVGRILPFTFAQLAIRAHKYGPNHGIKLDVINKKYKDRDEISTWSHQTRYLILKGHLLMRVKSQCFATGGLPPAGERTLLYSREDFVPYFSVCPHWRDGELMPMVKCAMQHIPVAPTGGGLERVAQETKLRFHPQNPIVTLCNNCRPMRRCPECPTEYLIEIKMTEDKSDPGKLFKHSLIVTRWSDLGDGSSPLSPEWAACCGQPGFDSFAAIGKRAISGTFESEVYGNVLPGQKIISLNPNKEKKGEAGHDWY